MSFYRIYRPQVIDEIDNLAVREQMLSFLHKERNDLPHAFLFSGPKGAGKTTAARLLAKLFNCAKLSATKGPCGKCDQCVSIAAGSNIDVLEIDAASNRGIDEMRTLRERIGLAPAAAAFKIYIIDEVHMLTTEAFNALLKTLEEPPAHAVFVMATTDPQKVPATIQSRCIHISFQKAGDTELANALERIVKSEKISIEGDAIQRIVTLADGSFRDAVKILEQASLQKKKITAEMIEKMAAAPAAKHVADMLAAIENHDAATAVAIVESFAAGGGDARAFLLQTLSSLHEKLLASVKKGASEDILALQKAQLKAFAQAYGEMRTSPIAHLPLELAIVELAGQKNDEAEEEDSAPVAVPAKKEEKKAPAEAEDEGEPLGLLTLEKLIDHWSDFIVAMKPYNNSISGVLRSARPTSVARGIVTITAFYPFHKEKLSEINTRQTLSDVLKRLFGEKVKVEIVLGKK